MHLHRQVRTVTPVIEPDDPPPPSVHVALGNAPCNGIGCSARTGIRCGYVDRRARSCPTAWCPGHRSVFEGAVYCALHAATMTGLQWDFGDSPHPDVDNQVPALVAWLSHAAEDDIVATLQDICREKGEVLVSDPVRRVFLGPERVRTWERAWKTCSALGVGARVAIAVEEANPTVVLAKVSSRVVAAHAAPRADVGDDARPEVVEMLFRHLVMPIAMALDCWRQGIPITAVRQAEVHELTGERAARPIAGGA